jgi:hypothetical protein
MSRRQIAAQDCHTDWAQINGGNLITKEEKGALDDWYIRKMKDQRREGRRSAHFPPPWIAEVTPNCFVLRDANGQALSIQKPRHPKQPRQHRPPQPEAECHAKQKGKD